MTRVAKRAAKRPGIFPTFFMSGFECSTFLWKDRGRRDLVAETQHRERAAEDYDRLRGLGIAVARGTLSYEGPVRKFLRVFPIFRTAYGEVAHGRKSTATANGAG